MAINVGLLPALDAMAEVMVSMDANPKLPSNNPNRNPAVSWMLPPRKTWNAAKLIRPIDSSSMELYRIREKTTPKGLAKK